MFKFGFSDDEKKEEQDAEEVKKKSKKLWLKCEEIKIGKNVVPEEFLEDDCPDIEYIEIEDKYKIRHVSTEIVTEIIKKRKNNEDSIFQAETSHSDLITAVYEGGLKIWQCTYDLLDYIYTNSLDFKDKKVLDLGCGAGILGIFAFVNGANVYFQDYNPEVVRYVTLPNVLLNETGDNKAGNCKFYSGDWKSFVDVTQQDFTKNEDKFDYILTSETIYNCDNYDKLNTLFKSRLKDSGTLYLAAKTYYFGVGGGTRQFEDMLRKDDRFNSETCWTNKEGVQREILKLTFK